MWGRPRVTPPHTSAPRPACGGGGGGGWSGTRVPAPSRLPRPRRRRVGASPRRAAVARAGPQAGSSPPSAARGGGGGATHTARPRRAAPARSPHGTCHPRGTPPPPPSPPRRSGRWAPVWRRDEPCGLRAGFPGLGLRGCVMPEGKSLRAGRSGISAGKATGAVRLPNRPHAAAWLLFIFFFLIFIFFPFSTERPQFPQQDLPV